MLAYQRSVLFVATDAEMSSYWWNFRYCTKSCCQNDNFAPSGKNFVKVTFPFQWLYSLQRRSLDLEASSHTAQGTKSWHNTIPNSQISQSTCPLSHNTTLITEMCRFLFWWVHCGIRDSSIVKLVFLWRAITTKTSSALAVKFNIDRNFCVVVVMIP